MGLLDCSASFSQSVSDFFSCDFTEKVTLQSRKRVDESCSARRGVRHGWPGLSLGTMRCTCAAITAGCMIQAPLRPIAPSDLPTDAFCFTCMRCARHRGRLLPPPPRTRTSACGLRPRRVRRHARRHARHVHVDARRACTCRQWSVSCVHTLVQGQCVAHDIHRLGTLLFAQICLVRGDGKRQHHTRRLAVRSAAGRAAGSAARRGSTGGSVGGLAPWVARCCLFGGAVLVVDTLRHSSVLCVW